MSNMFTFCKVGQNGEPLPEQEQQSIILFQTWRCRQGLPRPELNEDGDPLYDRAELIQFYEALQQNPDLADELITDPSVTI